jgi:hypothetical protein
MFQDSFKFVRACEKCQKFSGREQFSAMPLQPVLPDFPLAKWGLDFIGPINPPSSVGHVFILMETDYFTKWTEVVPLKNAQDEQVINFLESNIFACFGLPLEIISDNGSTFISANFSQFLSEFGVKHFTSSTYYPQGNGQAESTNKNLVKILKRIIDDKPHQWHTLLTYALWDDHTTTKNNTGHTPFSLLYGQEVVMPVELQLTSLRLAMQAEELNSTDISQRMNALLALEEQRNHALENLKKRQQTVKKYFDKRAKSVKFKVNDKVFFGTLHMLIKASILNSKNSG